MKCPSCSGEVPDRARFCPSCGAGVAPDGDTRVERPSEVPTVTAPPAPSSHPLNGSRFLPGAVLAGRYRIMGLLGRGGMGEVYRADDLKLGQPVALKFLPAAVVGDEERLSRFLTEVKIARQISHPNVCRVWDVGEVGGRHFLSMEYIDGEDLASLLRRIGRLPGEKALQIARQLCAGLAAAHDQGILHRDFKPANVMIDGRGRARITDFGLAGLAESFQGADLHAGTPAYMAPEQLAGEGISVRSDLYSLGLVLYELFTGRRPFEAATPAELLELQRGALPTHPSSHVDGIEPAVEQVILRCLEHDPRQRPSSALAVATAFPGGDPLAVAVAAGETPSPDVVAEAGSRGGLEPWVAGSCLAAVLLGTIVVTLLAGRTQVTRLVPLEKSPQVLAERARQIIHRLGHDDEPRDTLFGFDLDRAYLNYIARNDSSPDRWQRLTTPQPAAISFWYRQSPAYLIPLFTGSEPASYSDPAGLLAGMVNIRLDPMGRLIDLDAVPPELDESQGHSGDPDWNALFEEADLDPAAFRPTHAIWSPLVFADRRAAWEGTYPESPETAIRVEAAAYHGRPVAFRIIEPWRRGLAGGRTLLGRRSDPMRPPSVTLPRPTPVVGGVARRVTPLGTASHLTFVSTFILALVGATLMARRNLRLGRADRKGALRLATYLLATRLLVWLFGDHHVPDISELNSFTASLAQALYIFGVIWILYAALEPYLRRLWPQILVSWIRVLDADFRDSMVGRHLLIGSLVGVGMALLYQLARLLPGWLGQAPPMPGGPWVLWELEALRGLRYSISAVLVLHSWTFVAALLGAIVILLLRLLLRKTWLAALVFVIAVTLSWSLVPGQEHLWLAHSLVQAAGLVVFLRFGLLPLVVSFTTVVLLDSLPLTADFSAWYSGSSVLVLLIVLSLAAYGFWVSLAGRPLFRDELVSPPQSAGR